MPSKTDRQRRFLAADLERKREGRPTRTDMSEKQVKDFAKKPPRSNPRTAQK